MNDVRVRSGFEELCFTTRFEYEIDTIIVVLFTYINFYLSILL